MITVLKLHLQIWKLFYQRSVKLLRFERKNFYLYILSLLIALLGNIFLLYTAFNRVSFVMGWNFYNILALFGTFHITRGLFGLLMRKNLSNLFTSIRHAQLDLLLIRPASTWFLLSFNTVDLARIVDFIFGISLMIYTLFYVHWTWLSLLAYIGIVIIALIIIACTYMLIAMTAFFNMRDAGFSFVEKLMRSTTRFPLRFASTTTQFIFTWLLPFMFLSTIPVEALENRIHLSGAMFSALFISFIYLALTKMCWALCLKRYSSASS